MPKVPPIFASSVKGTEDDCRRLGGKPRKADTDFVCSFVTPTAMDKVYRVHKIVKNKKTEKIVATAVFRRQVYTFSMSELNLNRWFKHYNTKIGKPDEQTTSSHTTIVFYERPYKL